MRTAWFAVTTLAVCLHAQTGSVEGRVVSITGEPIRKAVVQLHLGFNTSRLEATYIEVTGADGSFAISGLPPSRDYRVIVSKDGFVATGELTLRPNSSETLRGVTITMRPLGILSGVVTDADGDPVHGAMVTLHAAFVGTPGGGSYGSQSTDDRGMFRFTRVEPGVYYLSARVHNFFLVGFGGDNTYHGPNAQLAPLPTYYPSETVVSLARPVVVGVGEQIPGLDIRLRTGRLYSIRGRVTPADLAAPGNLNVQITPLDGGGGSGTSARPEGGFSFRGLVPGRYLVRTLPETQARHSGSMVVTVGSADIEDLVLPVLPNLDLSGRIVVDGESEPKFDAPPRVRISAVGYNQNTATVEAGGEFTLRNVRHEPYWLTVESAGGMYVQSIRSVGTELTEGRFDLTAGPLPGPIEVTLARGAGKVTGQPPEPSIDGANRLIALWPKTPAGFDRAQGVRTANISSGRFWFQDLPPGDYYLAALEQLPLLTGAAHRFVSQFSGAATALTVAAGATVTAEPKLIPREAIARAIGNLR